MLGWIYVWRDEEINTHRVKVIFGNLWFYLHVYYPYSTPLPPTYKDYIERGRIIVSTCSRQEKWKNLRKPDYQDYCDLTLYELSCIIFLRAPRNERKEREDEWERLRSYYRRELPKEINLGVFWCPNRFDIVLPSLDLTFYFWKRLSRRDNKRKPKNVISWFESAQEEIEDHSDYLGTPLGTYSVNFSSLVWWLGNEDQEKLLEEMFGNV